MIAARFKRMNIPAIVIEKNARVGDHWRKRYPTLALHTIREHHARASTVVLVRNPPSHRYYAVLYQPFPSSWPLYTPRDKLADWMENYAHSQDLIVWTSSEVIPHPTYNPATKQWNVIVDRNGTQVKLNPVHIVVATGTLGHPRMIEVADSDKFAGDIIHGNYFPGGDRYKGLHVVVIGAGNSAMDVCEDCAHRGATSVTMVQRSSSCVVTREIINAKLASFWPTDVPTEIGDFKFAAMGLGAMRHYAQTHQQDMWDEEKELHGKLRKGGVKLNMGPDNAGQFNAVFERSGGTYRTF